MKNQVLNAELVNDLYLKAYRASYKKTEARLLLERLEELEEPAGETETPEMNRHRVISKALKQIDALLALQTALKEEARALSSYADALNAYDGENKALIVEDYRTQAVESLKARRALESKKRVIQDRIYKITRP